MLLFTGAAAAYAAPETRALGSGNLAPAAPPPERAGIDADDLIDVIRSWDDIVGSRAISKAADTRCANTCIGNTSLGSASSTNGYLSVYADDSSCDDGGPGSSHSHCELGSDCADCGPRPIPTADDDPEQSSTAVHATAVSERSVSYGGTAMSQPPANPPLTGHASPPAADTADDPNAVHAWQIAVWSTTIAATVCLSGYVILNVQTWFLPRRRSADDLASSGEKQQG